ncbi:MAG: transcriptional regulator [Chloroflexi bacterium]|nr:transcriptional regulator [Chloroflexota bacterium]
MSESNRSSAGFRFDEARKKVFFDRIMARFTGRPTEMLPFDIIRAELRQQNPFYQGIQEIPVDLIVGSVGRYREFTRRFLPLTDSLRERWIGVETLATSAGWPPIDAYKIGGVYFANDGNHRVSVARQLEIPTIEAHVWEYPSEVQIGPDDLLDDVLIRLGERSFMAKTSLAEIIPQHNIRFTSPGRYRELLAQIYNLQQTLSIIDEAEMPFQEAVAAWYEMIYLPTIEIIHDSTLMEDFPGRTEADLFVWLSLYRSNLEAIYGRYANLVELSQILADKYKEGSIDRMARQARSLLGRGELPPLADPSLDAVLEEE